MRRDALGDALDAQLVKLLVGALDRGLEATRDVRLRLPPDLAGVTRQEDGSAALWVIALPCREIPFAPVFPVDQLLDQCERKVKLAVGARFGLRLADPDRRGKEIDIGPFERPTPPPSGRTRSGLRPLAACTGLTPR